MPIDIPSYLLGKKSSGGGGGGTTDYDNLENKPSINGVTLTGNKTTADLNITVEVASITEEQINEAFS